MMRWMFGLFFCLVVVFGGLGIACEAGESIDVVQPASDVGGMSELPVDTSELGLDFTGGGGSGSGTCACPGSCPSTHPVCASCSTNSRGTCVCQCWNFTTP